jgi:cytochrome c553
VNALLIKESIMRVLIILIAVFLACFQAVAADSATGDADAGAAKAEDCTACHNAMVDLRGRGADAIASQTKAIRAGNKAHPPGIAELSDEDIADIAAYLDVLD